MEEMLNIVNICNTDLIETKDIKIIRNPFLDKFSSIDEMNKFVLSKMKDKINKVIFERYNDIEGIYDIILVDNQFTNLFKPVENTLYIFTTDNMNLVSESNINVTILDLNSRKMYGNSIRRMNLLDFNLEIYYNYTLLELNQQIGNEFSIDDKNKLISYEHDILFKFKNELLKDIDTYINKLTKVAFKPTKDKLCEFDLYAARNSIGYIYELLEKTNNRLDKLQLLLGLYV